MHSYKLFIDDERQPVAAGWVIARTSKEAIHIIRTFGLPIEIAFDYDLGGDDTTKKVLQWLFTFVEHENLVFDENFRYSVHSQNPVGAKYVRDFMGDLLRLSYDNKEYKARQTGRESI